MTDARALVERLVADGLERREARWLVEEFGAGDALDRAAARRLAGEPLQYVLGHWPFRGLDLDVDARALIPRPETEGLVDLAMSALARSGATHPVVLDVGCGSGAIGLALARELGARGVAVSLVGADTSEDALALARANARKHDVVASFVRSSWFDDLDPSLRGRCDLIVANPPYVGESELGALDPVLGYEPRGALVSADEGALAGFADVAHIVRAAPAWLVPGGHVVVEHGERHGDAAREVAIAAGLVEVVDHRDLAGWPRVLVGRRA